MHQQQMKFPKFERMTREERKEQLVRIVTNSLCTLTLLDVCKRAGIRKSNHVRGMLEELIEEGEILHGRPIPQSNGNSAITYQSRFPF